MKVLPVLFAAEHKHMLSQLAMLASKSYLGIPKEFDKLIISLRTAYITELSLGKEMTSYSDSLDSSSLAVKMYHSLDNKTDDYDLGEVQKVQDDVIDTSVYLQLNR